MTEFFQHDREDDSTCGSAGYDDTCCQSFSSTKVMVYDGKCGEE